MQGIAVIYRFEDFLLDDERRELRLRGAPVAVEPQVFDLIAYLVAHGDRVARKEDLLAAVWKTTFISDAALNTRIKEARQALGDNGRDQRLIRTVHRRGYRFVGAIEGGPEAPDAADVKARATLPAKRRGRVRFCTTSDGAGVAFATTGEGPPFVKVANWLTHLEYDEESPVWRHLIEAFSRDFTLVRYDERGAGLSDREIGDDEFGLEPWLRDLEAVVDALECERFPLLGISQGGAVAIAYAAAHPERVTHLVLQGAYARGRARRGPEQAELSRALIALTRDGWGVPESAHAQLFAARLIPRGSGEQLRWLVDLQRLSASRDQAVRFRNAFADLDVDQLLPRVQAPTLVLHSQRDQTVPFEEGRRLASRIEGARFVQLDSDNHLILEDEPAWPVMIGAIREFVGIARPA